MLVKCTLDVIPALVAEIQNVHEAQTTFDGREGANAGNLIFERMAPKPQIAHVGTFSEGHCMSQNVLKG